MDLLEFVSTARGSVIIVLLLCPVTALSIEWFVRPLKIWVKSCPWWPRACGLIKVSLKNFGYSEQDLLDDNVVLSMYADGWMFGFHHMLCGSLMLSVAYHGWEAAGAGGQTLFLLGSLADVALNVCDSVKKALLYFFPERFQRLGVPIPKASFIITVILHHPASMCFFVPMNLSYPDLREFHLLAANLLMASAVCVCTSQSKFALDTTCRNGLRLFKGLTVVQLTTILASRGWFWVRLAYKCLATFFGGGDVMFFVGGLVLAFLMHIFNMMLICDAVSASLKWLPKALPTGIPHSVRTEALHPDKNRYVVVPVGSSPAQPLMTRLTAFGLKREGIMVDVTSEKAFTASEEANGSGRDHGKLP